MFNAEIDFKKITERGGINCNKTACSWRLHRMDDDPNWSHASVFSRPECTHSQHDAPCDCLWVIRFPRETYSLSAVVCRQSCIHPHDRNSACWFLVRFFSHSSPASVDGVFFIFLEKCLYLLQRNRFKHFSAWNSSVQLRKFKSLPMWQTLICHLIRFHTVIEGHSTHQNSLCLT